MFLRLSTRVTAIVVLTSFMFTQIAWANNSWLNTDYRTSEEMQQDGFIGEEYIDTLQSMENFQDEKVQEINEFTSTLDASEKGIFESIEDTIARTQEVNQITDYMQGKAVADLQNMSAQMAALIASHSDRYVLYKNGKKVFINEHSQVERIENEKYYDKHGKEFIRNTDLMTYNDANQLIYYDASVVDSLGNTTTVKWENAVYYTEADELLDPRNKNGELASFSETVTDEAGVTTVINWTNVSYYTAADETADTSQLADKMASYTKEIVSAATPDKTDTITTSNIKYLKRAKVINELAYDPTFEEASMREEDNYDILITSFDEIRESLGVTTDRSWTNALYNDYNEVVYYEEASSTLGVGTDRTFSDATYDTYGRIVSFKDVSSTYGILRDQQRSSMQYNNLNQLISYHDLIIEDGITTNFSVDAITYNSNGQISSMHQIIETSEGFHRDLVKSEMLYNAKGLITHYREVYAKNGITYDLERSNIVHNANGFLISYDELLSEVGSYTAFDGEVVTINKTSSATRLSTTYDSNGNVSSYNETKTDPTGKVINTNRTNILYSNGNVVSYNETQNISSQFTQSSLSVNELDELVMTQGEYVLTDETITLDYTITKTFSGATYTGKKINGYTETTVDSRKPNVSITTTRTGQTYNSKGQIVSYTESISVLKDGVTTVETREWKDGAYDALGNIAGYSETLTNTSGGITFLSWEAKAYNPINLVQSYQQIDIVDGVITTTTRNNIKYDGLGRMISYQESFQDGQKLPEETTWEALGYNMSGMLTGYKEIITTGSLSKENIRNYITYNQDGRIIRYVETLNETGSYTDLSGTEIIIDRLSKVERIDTVFNASEQLLSFIQKEYTPEGFTHKVNKENITYSPEGNITAYTETRNITGDGMQNDIGTFDYATGINVAATNPISMAYTTVKVFENGVYDELNRMTGYKETQTDTRKNIESTVVERSNQAYGEGGNIVSYNELVTVSRGSDVYSNDTSWIGSYDGSGRLKTYNTTSLDSENITREKIWEAADFNVLNLIIGYKETNIIKDGQTQLLKTTSERGNICYDNFNRVRAYTETNTNAREYATEKIWMGSYGDLGLLSNDVIQSIDNGSVTNVVSYYEYNEDGNLARKISSQEEFLKEGFTLNEYTNANTKFFDLLTASALTYPSDTSYHKVTYNYRTSTIYDAYGRIIGSTDINYDAYGNTVTTVKSNVTFNNTNLETGYTQDIAYDYAVNAVNPTGLKYTVNKTYTASDFNKIGMASATTEVIVDNRKPQMTTTITKTDLSYNDLGVVSHYDESITESYFNTELNDSIVDIKNTVRDIVYADSGKMSSYDETVTTKNDTGEYYTVPQVTTQTFTNILGDLIFNGDDGILCTPDVNGDLTFLTSSGWTGSMMPNYDLSQRNFMNMRVTTNGPSSFYVEIKNTENAVVTGNGLHIQLPDTAGMEETITIDLSSLFTKDNKVLNYMAITNPSGEFTINEFDFNAVNRYAEENLPDINVKKYEETSFTRTYSCNYNNASMVNEYNETVTKDGKTTSTSADNIAYDAFGNQIFSYSNITDQYGKNNYTVNSYSYADGFMSSSIEITNSDYSSALYSVNTRNNIIYDTKGNIKSYDDTYVTIGEYYNSYDVDGIGIGNKVIIDATRTSKRLDTVYNKFNHITSFSEENVDESGLKTERSRSNIEYTVSDHVKSYNDVILSTYPDATASYTNTISYNATGFNNEGKPNVTETISTDTRKPLLTTKELNTFTYNEDGLADTTRKVLEESYISGENNYIYVSISDRTAITYTDGRVTSYTTTSISGGGYPEETTRTVLTENITYDKCGREAGFTTKENNGGVLTVIQRDNIIYQQGNGGSNYFGNIDSYREIKTVTGDASIPAVAAINTVSVMLRENTTYNEYGWITGSTDKIYETVNYASFDWVNLESPVGTKESVITRTNSSFTSTGEVKSYAESTVVSEKGNLAGLSWTENTTHTTDTFDMMSRAVSYTETKTDSRTPLITTNITRTNITYDMSSQIKGYTETITEGSSAFDSAYYMQTQTVRNDTSYDNFGRITSYSESRTETTDTGEVNTVSSPSAYTFTDILESLISGWFIDTSCVVGVGGDLSFSTGYGWMGAGMPNYDLTNKHFINMRISTNAPSGFYLELKNTTDMITDNKIFIELPDTGGQEKTVSIDISSFITKPDTILNYMAISDPVGDFTIKEFDFNAFDRVAEENLEPIHEPIYDTTVCNTTYTGAYHGDTMFLSSGEETTVIKDLSDNLLSSTVMTKSNISYDIDGREAGYTQIQKLGVSTVDGVTTQKVTTQMDFENITYNLMGMQRGYTEKEVNDYVIVSREKSNITYTLGDGTNTAYGLINSYNEITRTVNANGSTLVADSVSSNQRVATCYDNYGRVIGYTEKSYGAVVSDVTDYKNTTFPSGVSQTDTVRSTIAYTRTGQLLGYKDTSVISEKDIPNSSYTLNRDYSVTNFDIAGNVISLKETVLDSRTPNKVTEVIKSSQTYNSAGLVDSFVERVTEKDINAGKDLNNVVETVRSSTTYDYLGRMSAYSEKTTNTVDTLTFAEKATLPQNIIEGATWDQGAGTGTLAYDSNNGYLNFSAGTGYIWGTLAFNEDLTQNPVVNIKVKTSGDAGQHAAISLELRNSAGHLITNDKIRFDIPDTEGDWKILSLNTRDLLITDDKIVKFSCFSDPDGAPFALQSMFLSDEEFEVYEPATETYIAESNWTGNYYGTSSVLSNFSETVTVRDKNNTIIKESVSKKTDITYDTKMQESSYKLSDSTDGYVTETIFSDMKYDLMGRQSGYQTFNISAGIEYTSVRSDMLYENNNLVGYTETLREKNVTGAEIVVDKVSKTVREAKATSYNNFGQIIGYTDVTYDPKSSDASNWKNTVFTATDKRTINTRSNIEYTKHGQINRYEDTANVKGTETQTQTTLTYNEAGEPTETQTDVVCELNYIMENTYEVLEYDSMGRALRTFETNRDDRRYHIVTETLKTLSGYDAMGRVTGYVQTMKEKERDTGIFRSETVNTRHNINYFGNTNIVLSYSDNYEKSFPEGQNNALVLRSKWHRDFVGECYSDGAGGLMDYYKTTTESTTKKFQDETGAWQYTLKTTNVRTGTANDANYAGIGYDSLGRIVSYKDTSSSQNLIDGSSAVDTVTELWNQTYNELGLNQSYSQSSGYAGIFESMDYTVWGNAVYDNYGRNISSYQTTTDIDGIKTYSSYNNAAFDSYGRLIFYNKNDVEFLASTGEGIDGLSRNVITTWSAQSFDDEDRAVKTLNIVEVIQGAVHTLNKTETQSLYDDATGDISQSKEIKRTFDIATNEMLLRTDTTVKDITYDGLGRKKAYTTVIKCGIEDNENNVVKEEKYRDAIEYDSFGRVITYVDAIAKENYLDKYSVVVRTESNYASYGQNGAGKVLNYTEYEVEHKNLLTFEELKAEVIAMFGENYINAGIVDNEKLYIEKVVSQSDYNSAGMLHKDTNVRTSAKTKDAQTLYKELLRTTIFSYDSIGLTSARYTEEKEKMVLDDFALLANAEYDILYTNEKHTITYDSAGNDFSWIEINVDEDDNQTDIVRSETLYDAKTNIVGYTQTTTNTRSVPVPSQAVDSLDAQVSSLESLGLNPLDFTGISEGEFVTSIEETVVEIFSNAVYEDNNLLRSSTTTKNISRDCTIGGGDRAGLIISNNEFVTISDVNFYDGKGQKTYIESGEVSSLSPDLLVTSIRENIYYDVYGRTAGYLATTTKNTNGLSDEGYYVDSSDYVQRFETSYDVFDREIGFVEHQWSNIVSLKKTVERTDVTYDANDRISAYTENSSTVNSDYSYVSVFDNIVYDAQDNRTAWNEYYSETDNVYNITKTSVRERQSTVYDALGNMIFYKDTDFNSLNEITLADYNAGTISTVGDYSAKIFYGGKYSDTGIYSGSVTINSNLKDQNYSADKSASESTIIVRTSEVKDKYGFVESYNEVEWSSGDSKLLKQRHVEDVEYAFAENGLTKEKITVTTSGTYDVVTNEDLDLDGQNDILSNDYWTKTVQEKTIQSYDGNTGLVKDSTISESLYFDEYAVNPVKTTKTRDFVSEFGYLKNPKNLTRITTTNLGGDEASGTSTESENIIYEYNNKLQVTKESKWVDSYNAGKYTDDLVPVKRQHIVIDTVYDAENRMSSQAISTENTTANSIRTAAGEPLQITTTAKTYTYNADDLYSSITTESHVKEKDTGTVIKKTLKTEDNIFYTGAKQRYSFNIAYSEAQGDGSYNLIYSQHTQGSNFDKQGRSREEIETGTNYYYNEGIVTPAEYTKNRTNISYDGGGNIIHLELTKTEKGKNDEINIIDRAYDASGKMRYESITDRYGISIEKTNIIYECNDLLYAYVERIEKPGGIFVMNERTLTEYDNQGRIARTKTESINFAGADIGEKTISDTVITGYTADNRVLSRETTKDTYKLSLGYDYSIDFNFTFGSDDFYMSGNPDGSLHFTSDAGSGWTCSYLQPVDLANCNFIVMDVKTTAETDISMELKHFTDPSQIGSAEPNQAMQEQIVAYKEDDRMLISLPNTNGQWAKIFFPIHIKDEMQGKTEAHLIAFSDLRDANTGEAVSLDIHALYFNGEYEYISTSTVADTLTYDNYGRMATQVSDITQADGITKTQTYEILSRDTVNGNVLEQKTTVLDSQDRTAINHESDIQYDADNRKISYDINSTDKYGNAYHKKRYDITYDASSMLSGYKESDYADSYKPAQGITTVSDTTYDVNGRQTSFIRSGIDYDGNAFTETRTNITYDNFGRLSGHTSVGTNAGANYSYIKSNITYADAADAAANENLEQGEITGYHEAGTNSQRGIYTLTHDNMRYNVEGKILFDHEFGTRRGAEYDENKTFTYYAAGEPSEGLMSSSVIASNTNNDSTTRVNMEYDAEDRLLSERVHGSRDGQAFDDNIVNVYYAEGEAYPGELSSVTTTSNINTDEYTLREEITYDGLGRLYSEITSGHKNGRDFANYTWRTYYGLGEEFAGKESNIYSYDGREAVFGNDCNNKMKIQYDANGNMVKYLSNYVKNGKLMNINTILTYGIVNGRSIVIAKEEHGYQVNPVSPYNMIGSMFHRKQTGYTYDTKGRLYSYTEQQLKSAGDPNQYTPPYYPAGYTRTVTSMTYDETTNDMLQMKYYDTRNAEFRVLGYPDKLNDPQLGWYLGGATDAIANSYCSVFSMTNEITEDYNVNLATGDVISTKMSTPDYTVSFDANGNKIENSFAHTLVYQHWLIQEEREVNDVQTQIWQKECLAMIDDGRAANNYIGSQSIEDIVNSYMPNGYTQEGFEEGCIAAKRAYAAMMRDKYLTKLQIDTQDPATIYNIVSAIVKKFGDEESKKLLAKLEKAIDKAKTDDELEGKDLAQGKLAKGKKTSGKKSMTFLLKRPKNISSKDLKDIIIDVIDALLDIEIATAEDLNNYGYDEVFEAIMGGSISFYAYDAGGQLVWGFELAAYTLEDGTRYTKVSRTEEVDGQLITTMRETYNGDSGHYVVDSVTDGNGVTTQHIYGELVYGHKIDETRVSRTETIDGGFRTITLITDNLTGAKAKEVSTYTNIKYHKGKMVEFSLTTVISGTRWQNGRLEEIRMVTKIKQYGAKFDEKGRLIEYKQDIWKSTAPNKHTTVMYQNLAFNTKDQVIEQIITTHEWGKGLDYAGNQIILDATTTAHRSNIMYDKQGRVISFTEYTYDPTGEVTTTSQGDIVYDYAGRMVGYRNEDGDSARFVYDNLGLIKASEQFGEYSYDIVYDAGGNKIQWFTAKDQDGQQIDGVHSVEYNALGQQIKVYKHEYSHGDSFSMNKESETTYSYDTSGNRIVLTENIIEDTMTYKRGIGSILTTVVGLICFVVPGLQGLGVYLTTAASLLGSAIDGDSLGDALKKALVVAVTSYIAGNAQDSAFATMMTNAIGEAGGMFLTRMAINTGLNMLQGQDFKDALRNGAIQAAAATAADALGGFLENTEMFANSPIMVNAITDLSIGTLTGVAQGHSFQDSLESSLAVAIGRAIAANIKESLGPDLAKTPEQIQAEGKTATNTLSSADRESADAAKAAVSTGTEYGPMTKEEYRQEVASDYYVAKLSEVATQEIALKLGEYMGDKEAHFISILVTSIFVDSLAATENADTPSFVSNLVARVSDILSTEGFNNAMQAYVGEQLASQLPPGSFTQGLVESFANEMLIDFNLGSYIYARNLESEGQKPVIVEGVVFQGEKNKDGEFTGRKEITVESLQKARDAGLLTTDKQIAAVAEGIYSSINQFKTLMAECSVNSNVESVVFRTKDSYTLNFKESTAAGVKSQDVWGDGKIRVNKTIDGKLDVLRDGISFPIPEDSKDVIFNKATSMISIARNGDTVETYHIDAALYRNDDGNLNIAILSKDNVDIYYNSKGEVLANRTFDDQTKREVFKNINGDTMFEIDENNCKYISDPIDSTRKYVLPTGDNVTYIFSFGADDETLFSDQESGLALFGVKITNLKNYQGFLQNDNNIIKLFSAFESDGSGPKEELAFDLQTLKIVGEDHEYKGFSLSEATADMTKTEIKSVLQLVLDEVEKGSISLPEVARGNAVQTSIAITTLGADEFVSNFAGLLINNKDVLQELVLDNPQLQPVLNIVMNNDNKMNVLSELHFALTSAPRGTAEEIQGYMLLKDNNAIANLNYFDLSNAVSEQNRDKYNWPAELHMSTKIDSMRTFLETEINPIVSKLVKYVPADDITLSNIDSLVDYVDVMHDEVIYYEREQLDAVRQEAYYNFVGLDLEKEYISSSLDLGLQNVIATVQTFKDGEAAVMLAAENCSYKNFNYVDRDFVNEFAKPYIQDLKNQEHITATLPNSEFFETNVVENIFNNIGDIPQDLYDSIEPIVTKLLEPMRNILHNWTGYFSEYHSLPPVNDIPVIDFMTETNIDYISLKFNLADRSVDSIFSIVVDKMIKSTVAAELGKQILQGVITSLINDWKNNEASEAVLDNMMKMEFIPSNMNLSVNRLAFEKFIQVEKQSFAEQWLEDEENAMNNAKIKFKELYGSGNKAKFYEYMDGKWEEAYLN